MVWTMIAGEVNYSENIKKGRGAQEWKRLRRCSIFVNQWGYINYVFLVTFIEDVAVSALGQNGRVLLLIDLAFKNLVKIRVDLFWLLSLFFNEGDKRKYEEIDYYWFSTKQGLCRAAASLIRPTYSVSRDVPFWAVYQVRLSCWSAGLRHPVDLYVRQQNCPKAKHQLCERKFHLPDILIPWHAEC